MEQRAHSKSILAIVVIFTIMATLLIPAPVYAAGQGHEPPPPKPPANDMGNNGKPGKSGSHAISDLPGDTSIVVTSHGTPLPLASQLSIEALSANSTAKLVKFCKSSNPDFFGKCTDYTSIQSAIDAVAKTGGNVSGVFYVAVDYPEPDGAPVIPQPAIVLNQHKFRDPSADADLNILGGYIFSGSGIGTQGSQPTELFQPFTIRNINDDSSVSLDNFSFYITSFIGGEVPDPDSPSPSVVEVNNSHNVSLSNLAITNYATVWHGALNIGGSKNVSLSHAEVHDFGRGPGIVISEGADIKLEDISVEEVTGDGINVVSSGLRADGNHSIADENTWDPSITLEDVLVNSTGSGSGVCINFSDHVLIKDSTIISGKKASYDSYPYAAVVTYTADHTSLDNVTAFGNDKGDGVWIFDSYNTLMNQVNANSTNFYGVSFFWGGGSTKITDSHFDGNGINGIYAEHYIGDITLDRVTANGNGSFGSVIVNLGPVDILDSQFNNNAAAGLIAAGSSRVSLSGGQADNNGSFGAALLDAGGLFAFARQYPTIKFGEYSNMYLSDHLGDIQIQDSTFSGNKGGGLQAMLATVPNFSVPDASLAGGSITLENVVANRNENFGIQASISSSSIPFGMNLKISGDVDQTVNYGNFINMDGVEADDNGTYGISAMIHSLNPGISMAPLLEVPAGIDAFQPTVNLNRQVDFQENAGNFITFKHIVASNNAGWGVNATIEASGGSRNSIDVTNKLSYKDYVFPPTSSQGTLDSQVTTLVTLTSGNQINMGDVTANDNGLSGLMAYIISKEQRDNSINASSTVTLTGATDNRKANLVSNVAGSMNISLISGNQINLQNIEADRNSSLCELAASCETMAAIIAHITSNDTVINSLEPKLTTIFLDYMTPHAGETATNLADMDNSLLAAIHSGNLIRSEDVDASNNAVSGIDTLVESASSANNTILPEVSVKSWHYQSESGIQGSNILMDAGVDNNLQILVDSRNAIEMDDVTANSNQGDGVAAAIRITRGTTINNLNGVLYYRNYHYAFNETGQARITSDDHDSLGATVFNDDRIDLNAVEASFNAGNGITSSISVRDSRYNTVALASRSDTWNWVRVHNGLAALDVNEDNNLSADTNANNLIYLKDVLASSNNGSGVQANIDSMIFTNNTVDIDLVHFGTGATVVEFGTPVNTYNLIAAASASLTSVSGISLMDVLANQNGQDDLNAQITSANLKINQAAVDVMAEQTYGIFYETWNFEKNYSIFGLAEVLIDYTNFIEVDNLVNSRQGTNGREASVSSNDSVFNSAVTYEFTHIIELIGQSYPVEPPITSNQAADEQAVHLENVTGIPWQIINVYMDPGKNGGTLSCQFGTTYLYLEKMGASAPDFEWARVELSPCIVSGGTTGTFTGLGQGDLPGALPDGVTFQGKAFDFSLSGATSLGGAINVRFTLPAGFSLPSGKQLAILWFDPAAKQWVELTTYAGGVYVNAYASSTGAFVLVLK